MLIVLMLAAIGQSGCAKKGFPEGGPADTSGPTVVKTQPTTGESRVDRASPLVIEFSEPVDREKFKTNLFVSPPIVGEPSVEWKDNRATVVWPESLRADVTYRVTIGTNLTDRRNNPMIEPATIAFSTGDTLDTGRIVGRAHRGADAAGALEILAYRLDTAGSWDPTRPDFITTTDEKGLFDLSYLPLARFRLLAVADRNRNHAPDPGEEVGFPVADIDLTLAVEPEPHRIFTTLFDTTTFTIKSGTVAGDGAILVALTHPPDTSTWDSQLFAVEDSAASAPVRAEVLRPLRARSSVVAVYSEDFRPGVVYRIRLTASPDEALPLRNETGIAATPGECYVRWISPVDTTGPLVSLTHLPTPGIASTPRAPFGLEFDKPVAAAGDTVPILQVVDSLGQPIPGRTEWADARRLWFHPEGNWPETTLVLAVIDSTRLHDRRGIPPPRQPFHWRFHPLSFSLMGSALCRITAPGADWSSHTCHLEARVTASKVTLLRTAPVDSTFEWEMPSGGWILSAWFDLNADRRWTPGALSPFGFAEPRVYLTDTLYVRERFTVEDIVVRF